MSGVAKVTVQTQIARGELFTSAQEVYEFLKKYLVKNITPKYHFDQLSTDELEDEIQTNVGTVFKTTAGPAFFHIMIFTANSEVFKVCSRLCICTAYHLEYASCSLFKEYQLVHQTFTPTSLCSSVLPPTQISDESDDDDEDDACGAFIKTYSVVVVAAPSESVDTVWIVHVETNCVCFSKESTDDYGHKIPAGMKFLKGHFAEWVGTFKDSTIFRLPKKVTYFYEETVAYPYVEMEAGKKGLLLKNTDYIDIICHIEHTNHAHL